MKVAIFTEDSGVKHPEIKYNGDLKRGVDVEKIPNFLDKLENEDLEIPSIDLENEEQYRDALSDFVRPAKLMFSGLFKEARNFYNELNNITEIELYIISGRYGLVNSDENIIPYKAYMETQEDLKELDKRTDFSSEIIREANNYDLNLFFLAKRYLNHLVSENTLKKINTDIFIVTGPAMKEEIKKNNFDNLKIFSKKGIARISWQNRKKIKNIIKEKNSKGQ